VEAVILAMAHASMMEVTLPASQPLCVVDGYELHPLRHCSENAVAEAFVQICQRGNPALQGRPLEDLTVLGRALYRKAGHQPFAVAFTSEGSREPVALNLGWDLANGSVWDGITVPASLACHAAIAGAALEPPSSGYDRNIQPRSSGPLVSSQFA